MKILNNWNFTLWSLSSPLNFTCLGMSTTTCLPWSNSSSAYECRGGESYMKLNTSMKVSDKENCSSLCEEQNYNGCCYLEQHYGCYWKKGADSTKRTSRTTTQCSRIGIFLWKFNHISTGLSKLQLNLSSISKNVTLHSL